MDRNTKEEEVNGKKMNYADILKIVQEKDERMVKVKVWKAKDGRRKWKRRKQRRRKSQERGWCERRLLLTSPQQRNGRGTN